MTTSKLRLGPLPRAETVNKQTDLLKADLERYPELYSQTYGEPMDAVTLTPHMQ
ncbi:Protein of unknown function (DUF2274) [Spongiibacter sp. IMCC21906]|uniref:DUF2274 domain-containing protein n=1 Tax=Spongiibacter sp. IMCC21906 TaxID=1620392 RepID=UPI00062DDC6C|nr:DUF2274 domain-containing protein [Spongiibacter sp. IMCC21906]AKH70565.1 Protein of unknown function (DUF2274) [Spongiibacter sp. IMCC21906]